MKTSKLFIAIVLLSFVTSNAQITKGNWMMGGNLSLSESESGYYDASTSQNFKASRLLVNGSIGYFPIDKLAVGVSPYFSWSNPEGSKNSGIGYGFGPFARYYYLKPEKRYNIFSHLEYIYYTGYSNGKKISNTNQFGIKNGVAIFLNSSVALELSLNYNNSKVSSESGSESKFKEFNIGVGFQIHLEK
mgnify:CR=1 FL=1